jgi:putative ABC transport system permease protein
MNLLSVLSIALKELRRSKLRSLLTALGMIIGVAAVITLVSLGEGARREVEAQVQRLGENVILVFPGARSLGGVSIGGGSVNTLTAEDARALQEELPEVVAASPEVRSQRQVIYGARNWSTRIYGQSADYLMIRQWGLETGRMFTEEELQAGSQVAVVGQTIVEELFENTDPMGETIRVRGLPLRVIGVLERKGMSLMGSVQDDIIIIPYTTAFQKVSGRTHAMVINVQVYDRSVMTLAQQRITDLLRERHGLAPDQPDDFTVQTQEEIASAATATSRTMTALLGAIAAVSMLVGGIGIMNILLVSVTERTREIGLRVALGARDSSILGQFLVEALVLALLGGACGVLAGAGATYLLAQRSGMPAVLAHTAVLYSVAIAALIGLVFGLFPALKASRLDPIVALRHE